MSKKLSNIFEHYHLWLKYLSESGFRSLSLFEQNSIKTINNKGFLVFWDNVNIKEIFEQIINDLIEFPEAFDYFKYTKKQANQIQSQLEFPISRNQFINLLIEKNMSKFRMFF